MARCSPDDGLPDHLYFGPADEEWRTDDTPLDAEGNEIAQMAKGYDVRKIFTRSVDSKGHSDKVQVKMVSSQVSLISKWVEDRRTKYRSNQDFIRDAVYHRLHQMNEIYGEGQPVTMAYWRKFNALHLWMERALNNDEQTNGEMLPISLEQLAGLKVTCERVAADPTLGPTLLPTGGRFFFGSTDYDEWYVGDCIETANELDRILREEEAWCRAGNRPHVFHYCSSW